MKFCPSNVSTSFFCSIFFFSFVSLCFNRTATFFFSGLCLVRSFTLFVFKFSWRYYTCSLKASKQLRHSPLTHLKSLKRKDRNRRDSKHGGKRSTKTGYTRQTSHLQIYLHTIVKHMHITQRFAHTLYTFARNLQDEIVLLCNKLL